jgi:hypothetical protein
VQFKLMNLKFAGMLASGSFTVYEPGWMLENVWVFVAVVQVFDGSQPAWSFNVKPVESVGRPPVVV